MAAEDWRVRKRWTCFRPKSDSPVLEAPTRLGRPWHGHPCGCFCLSEEPRKSEIPSSEVPSTRELQSRVAQAVGAWQSAVQDERELVLELRRKQAQRKC